MKQVLRYTFFFLLFSALASAEFKPAQHRYLSSADLISTISALYPSFKNLQSGVIPARCSSIRFTNSGTLGFQNPALGKPMVDRPTPALVRWMNDCIVNYLKFEFPASGLFRQDLVADYFPGDVILANHLNQNSSLKKYLFEKSWASLPDTHKKSIIETSILRLIGPNKVLIALGVPGGTSQYANQISGILANQLSADSKVKEALEEIQLAIVFSDEFLRY